MNIISPGLGYHCRPDLPASRSPPDYDETVLLLAVQLGGLQDSRGHDVTRAHTNPLLVKNSTKTNGLLHFKKKN
jgi:hypothetical protein